MFFTDKKRKKNLIFSLLALFIFSGVIFVFSDVQSAHAGTSRLNCEVGAGFTDCMKAGGKSSSVVGDTITTGFKWLLYGIFVMFGWMASLAITIFEWVIQPKYISDLLNGTGVYESWKFVRDFFNLFFILVLLYIAFTVVFQINKDFKKTILSLVLAALFINFSFPVSRFLIDATNVPMYFFANSMMANNRGGGVFSESMKASSIKNILIPGSGVGISEVDFNKQDVSRLLVAIIFIFLFSVTLLVLAMMFVIRLVALVVLVIFSSVGFAASIIPGMGQYSKMWWDNFWKYALFGPAAMLMLLIATRFFSQIGDESGPLMAGLKSVAGNNVVAADRDFFASMALFSIPIIMLWMAMGLAQKMSIAGASSVVGWGQKVSKWAGRQTLNGGKWLAYGNPVARGVKEGAKEKSGFNKLAKWWKAPSKVEAGIKGGIVGVGTAGGVRGGAKSELDKIRYNEVRDAVEEHKKNKTSHSQLVLDLGSSNKVKAQSAAMAMAQNDDIQNTAEFTAGLAAVAGDADMTNDFVKKGQSAIRSVGDLTTALTALGDDSKSAAALIDKVNSDAMNMGHADYANFANSSLFQRNPTLQGRLDSRLKKEGHVQTIVDHRAAQPGGSYDIAYTNLVASMSPEELAKQEDSLHGNGDFVAYVQNHSGANDTFSDAHRKDVFAKMNGKNKAAWARNGIQP